MQEESQNKNWRFFMEHHLNVNGVVQKRVPTVNVSNSENYL